MPGRWLTEIREIQDRAIAQTSQSPKRSSSWERLSCQPDPSLWLLPFTSSTAQTSAFLEARVFLPSPPAARATAGPIETGHIAKSSDQRREGIKEKKIIIQRPEPEAGYTEVKSLEELGSNPSSHT